MHTCVHARVCVHTSPLSSLPSNLFRHVSKGLFDRVLQRWARGPIGCEDTLSESPWAEVNWVIDGHNEKRRKEFRAGSRLTPDESMVTWTGAAGPGGMPHLSFIKRKPKPLGAEFKSAYDGSTGICLFLETQEGKVRMARKMFCDTHPATTATTVRMLKKMGCSEKALPAEKKLRRRITAGLWFASRKTVRACEDELGVEFTGTTKTATRGFPAQVMRWTLATMERGEHCTFKEEGKDLQAIGWVDVHFKLCITTHGSSAPGSPAIKKRQRADGRNYQIQVPRPAVIAEHQAEMGWVDRHNRFRQAMLSLQGTWKTKRWQTRMQLEVFAIALVESLAFFQCWAAR